MENIMPIGELIGRLAKQKGISLRSLAYKVQMNYRTLYAAVKRKSNHINDKYLPALARELDCTVEYLTGIENPYDNLSYSERVLLRSISDILDNVDSEDRRDMGLHIAFFLEQQKDLILQTFVPTREKSEPEPTKWEFTDEDLINNLIEAGYK